MSNESSSLKVLTKEEERLEAFYNSILESKDGYEEQDKFILQLICTKISQLKIKEKKSNRLNDILRISIMLLAGSSTVLLGLNINEENSAINNNIVLIITAIITFLSGLAIFWNIEDYWIRYKVMHNRLKKLRHKYAFFLIKNKSTGIPKLENSNFLDELLNIIGDDYWEKFMEGGSDPK